MLADAIADLRPDRASDDAEDELKEEQAARPLGKADIVGHEKHDQRAADALPHRHCEVRKQDAAQERVAKQGANRFLERQANLRGGRCGRFALAAQRQYQ